MPWTGQEFAAKHNKKLRGTPKAAKGAAVANAVLAKSGDEGKAIRIGNAVANGTVKRHGLGTVGKG